MRSYRQVALFALCGLYAIGQTNVGSWLYVNPTEMPATKKPGDELLINLRIAYTDSLIFNPFGPDDPAVPWHQDGLRDQSAGRSSSG